MATVEQTKGSFRLTGATNIEKVEQKDFGWIKKANLTVKTLKDNFVNTSIEMKNGKGLDIKIKANGDEKSTSFGISKAVDQLKETFKNEDMVFVVGVTDYDTYRNEFVLKPSGVFASSTKYDDEDFKETNFVEQEIIFDKVQNGKVLGSIVTFFGEIVEVEFKVENDLVEEFEKFKYGDLVTIVFSVINKPIYVDADDSTSTYKPKGRGVSGGFGKKTVDGYTKYNIIVGIKDIENGKYTRQDIREAQAEYERKQAEFVAKKENTTSDNIADENEDDLPY